MHVNTTLAVSFTLFALALSPSLALAAPTFCGNTGDATTQRASVWNELRKPSSVICTSCHSTNSTLEPGMLADYIRTAFEMDTVDDWLKSSYWAPTETKAYSAITRMSNGSMPPGGGAASHPIKTLISSWYFTTVPSCAGSPTPKACIWGTNTEDVSACVGGANKGKTCTSNANCPSSTCAATGSFKCKEPGLYL